MSMSKAVYSDIEKRYIGHVEKYIFMLSDELFSVADKKPTQELSS